jgi:hypothetical protein
VLNESDLSGLGPDNLHDVRSVVFKATVDHEHAVICEQDADVSAIASMDSVS